MDPFSAINQQLFHHEMDIKHVQDIQAMHSERILKLERKQADDAALKSVWTSPFPSVLTGTPNQGPIHTPSANVFDDFDDEHCQSLLGSLHLDEEPVRRGASRANSVRFADDFSAIQGSGWAAGHVPRPSNDFPARPSSAFGRSHSMERTMSHKSEGRHSSAHSVHSMHSTGRTSSLGLNNHFTIGDDEDGYDMPAPPPGFFLLGTVPTIIRCWLNEDFSHGAMLYAVVCTGSQKSTVDYGVLKALRLLDQVQRDASGNSHIRLPVYLPEAVVTHPTSRPCSPGPRLPTLTVNFDVTDNDPAKASSSKKVIRVFLGNDTLRAHTADLMLSKNEMHLSGDDGNRLRVPFVRPEDDSVFKNIVTGHLTKDKPQLKGTAAPFTPAEKHSALPSQSQSRNSENEPTMPATSSRGRPPVNGEEGSENEASDSSAEAVKAPLKQAPKNHREKEKLEIDTRSFGNGTSDDFKSATTTTKSLSSIGKSPTSTTYGGSDTRDSTSAGGIWSSWRSSGAPPAPSSDDAKEGTSTSGYNKPGRGIRSMKVLKPSKALPTPGRSVSGGIGMGATSTHGSGQTKVGTGSSYEPPSQSPGFGAGSEERRKSGGLNGLEASASARWDAKKAAATEKDGEEPKKMRLISGSKNANPIGTASAFSWMKPGSGNAKPSVKSSD